MTNDNQDALQCADSLESQRSPSPYVDRSAAHLRRLLRENEAKDALLRQALGALEFHQDQTRPIYGTQNAIAAIRKHLDQKTT